MLGPRRTRWFNNAASPKREGGTPGRAGGAGSAERKGLLFVLVRVSELAALGGKAFFHFVVVLVQHVIVNRGAVRDRGRRNCALAGEEVADPSDDAV